MAVYATQAQPFAGTSVRTGSLFTAIVKAVSDWNDSRVTRNSLNALSDRELDDIGLTRGDIDFVAHR